ncbi:ATP/GTP-binding protein [Streptomyces sp. XH2]|uniref:ATP/GTP-binding protein n=1 Tax=Streptomyces sp. XH2 TaxID=3412483 RepID=UPI003C7CE661
MSDDTGNNVVHLPARGSDSGGMPDAPDGGDLFYSEPPHSSPGSVVPPESPAETTMELPPVRGPISPETALRETGIPGPSDSDEYEEGEYVQSRSLADRLGDWLEFRLDVARDRHAGEASFREAEIARKAALLEARTAQETAMMEQNGKLRTAMMKAKSDKAAARGKADAARSSASGMGADKGRSKAGGAGGSRGGGSSGGSGRNGSGRGSGTNGSATGPGRGSGSGNSPKGTGKGPDRSASGRKGGSKGNESSGGSRGRQNASGGSGSGKAGTGKGSSDGSGKKGSGSSGSGNGGSKGGGGKPPRSSASSPAQERARGRQERAAARQAARQQRRSAAQAAGLADRSKDRDQARADKQAGREERRRSKAERAAAKQAKRDAAKAAVTGRTTLGAAVAEEAQRRWDKRRADAKDKAAKDGDGGKGADATTEKGPKGGPEAAADGPKGKAAEDDKQSGEKPSDDSSDKDAKDSTSTGDVPKPDDVKGPPGADASGDGRSFKERFKDFFAKGGEGTAPPEAEEPSQRAKPEDLGFTVDSPGRPSHPPRTEPAEEEIPDAVIVDDPSDPFGAHVTSPASLPRAPEPHTQRPGTTRPPEQEDPMASEVSKTVSGQAGTPARHRTDITFDEYLMEIANIAISAAHDSERAEHLADSLRKVADALRDMAVDLVGDHNIATEVVDQITNLADGAMCMKQLAERCATECEIASEAARIAAMAVGRTYGQDIQAMDDAGLAHASAAAHHD